ncbi:hypothetical protein QQ045_001010 [Rhodiola kirilowii]
MAAAAVSSVSAKDGKKAPNLIERAKEEIEAVFYSGETHGFRNDIDQTTALDDVKAPTVFERVKEELEALAQTIHSKKRDESETSVVAKNNFDLIAAGSNGNEKTSEPVNIKEGTTLHRHKETHGRRNDINEDTPIDAVKAPSVLQRAKEEIEALVETIHPKKEPSVKGEGWFQHFIAVTLQKVCHPWDRKKD